MSAYYPHDSYYSYAAAATPTAAATPPPTHDCGPLGLSCAIGGIGNALGGVSNDLQTRFHKGVVASQHNADQVVNGPGKFLDKTGKDIGKNIHDTIFGEANAIQGGFGQYLPYIAIGGGLLILLLILKDGKVI